MPSNREAYFAALKRGVSKSIVDFVLQAINGYTYSDLAQHLDDEIKDYNKFLNTIERYLDGEMIEYILNKSYFLSIPFYVDKNVLIPRQETEQLVLDTIKLIKEKFNRKVSVLDMCSGSGCIGISIAKEIDAEVDMVDISKKANEIAKNKLPVRDIEQMVKEEDVEKKNKIKRHSYTTDSNYRYVEDIMAEKLDTKVKIKDKKIEIKFTNVADLNRILEILKIKG